MSQLPPDLTKQEIAFHEEGLKEYNLTNLEVSIEDVTKDVFEQVHAIAQARARIHTLECDLQRARTDLVRVKNSFGHSCGSLENLLYLKALEELNKDKRRK